MQKIFRELFKQFVAKNGVEPKGIELLQMKFKANELKRQADKIKVVDFKKTPTKVRPGREATVDTLKTKSDDVAAGTLQADIENLKVDAEDLKNQLIQNKNKLLDDLDDFLETGGQPFKKKDNKFLGGSMHEEGQLRTGIREFLKDELKNGRLKLDKLDTARIMEYSPMKEHDPILVFKRIYGDDAYDAAGKFPGAFENGRDYNHYREIFKENMDESYLKVKTEENLGDGRLLLTESDEVRTPIKDEDVPFAGGGVVKKIIKSITMKNKDPMDSMKELNEVLKRRKEFDLTDSEVDEIMEAGNEWIFQRDPDNLFVPTKDKPKTLFDDQVQVFKDSEGGIKGINIGGDDEFKKGMGEAMEEGMRESENMKRLGLDPASQKDYFKYEEMKEAGQMEKNVTGSSDLSAAEELRIEFPGITDEMIDNILMDTNQQRIAEVKQTMREALEMQNKGMNTDQIIEVFTKTPRSKNADGGRPRSTGLNYLLGEDDNNRVPYASGGRRGFLKLLAGLGAAGAAFKTGLLGLGKKSATKQVAKEIVTTSPVPGKPEWFDALINKVMLQGDDVTKKLATQERQVVHKLEIDKFEEVTVTRNLDDGQIRVEYEAPSNTGEAPIDLIYKPGVADETTKIKPADEFYAVESEPRVVNYDGDIEFDGENMVNSVDDLMSDTSKLKEIATGKKSTMSEFVNSKKKKDKVGKLNTDQMEQSDFIETKYGPGPDPSDYDDGYAAGGITKLIKKLNDINPGSTKLGKLSKPMNKKMKEKRALEQAIRDFEKRTKTKNPLGLSEQFIRGLNKKVKKQMSE